MNIVRKLDSPGSIIFIFDTGRTLYKTSGSSLSGDYMTEQKKLNFCYAFIRSWDKHWFHGRCDEANLQDRNYF